MVKGKAENGTASHYKNRKKDSMTVYGKGKKQEYIIKENM